MYISSAGEVFGRVRHFRLAHKLKTGAVFEGKKIRAEVRFRIAISVIGCGPKIFHEEITGCFQVIHVQRNMFDFHAVFDLLMSFAEFVSPVHKGQTARTDDAPASPFCNSSIRLRRAGSFWDCLQRNHGCMCYTQTVCRSPFCVASFPLRSDNTPEPLHHKSFRRLLSAITETKH